MEVITWSQIIILGVIFVLIMIICYLIKKLKQIIKELLNYLEEYPHLFKVGLCSFVMHLMISKIISEDKFIDYKAFIRNNHPHKKFPKEFSSHGAYWFYYVDGESPISKRIEYLKLLLNE